jgi:hypothetical protein
MKAVAAYLQFLLQFAEVINLAVEDDRHPWVTTTDGLVSSGKVNDGETAHAQTGFAFNHGALVVRPTMANHAAHVVKDARTLLLIHAP